MSAISKEKIKICVLSKIQDIWTELMEKLSYENILTNITLHQIDSTSLHLLFQRAFLLQRNQFRF
jgi:hypothetical protein